jgi:lipoate-protein ligase A
MQYMDLSHAEPGANLTEDERLLDTAESGGGGEVLRFWESPEYFVVVGYGNKAETEVNLPACRQRGIPVLRRCSGGGTVVQGPGCLNYALVLSIAQRPGLENITAANRYIMARNCAALAGTLKSPAAKVAVQGHTDLAWNGLKFSGNAQRRRRHFLLFHGTFLLDFNLAMISELLPPPSRQPEYRANRPHENFLINLNIPAETVKVALRQAWQD